MDRNSGDYIVLKKNGVLSQVTKLKLSLPLETLVCRLTEGMKNVTIHVHDRAFKIVIDVDYCSLIPGTVLCVGHIHVRHPDTSVENTETYLREMRLAFRTVDHTRFDVLAEVSVIDAALFGCIFHQVRA